MCESFPERLKYARDKIGVSQEEFARRLGISRASLTLYENGRRVPDISVLKKIHNETKVSLYFLLGISDVESDSYIGANETTGLSQKSIEALCDSERLQFFANRLLEQPEKADELHTAFCQYSHFLGMCKKQDKNDQEAALMLKFIEGALDRRIIELIRDILDYVTEADRKLDDDDGDEIDHEELFWREESFLNEHGKSPLMAVILPLLNKKK